MIMQYKDYIIRPWEVGDRKIVVNLITNILAEYGLTSEPGDADKDVEKVEEFYLKTGGEFWVIEKSDNIVGSAAYYPIKRGNHAVEIRKMYLIPEVRGQGLGNFLLRELETKIKSRGFQEIYIETATILKEAVKLYESCGYQPTTGVETKRCDLVYKKVFISC
ncbi:MAG: GNAT family N-acetyltransferase [Microcoleaceae cyanobacterium]